MLDGPLFEQIGNSLEAAEKLQSRLETEEQEKAEFAKNLIERMRVAQGLCGRILFQVLENGSLTESETSPENIRGVVNYARLSPLARASSHHTTRSFVVESTPDIAVPDSEQHPGLSKLRVHRYRPKTYSFIDDDPNFRTSYIPDMSTATYIVELIAERNDVSITRTTDLTYGTYDRDAFENHDPAFVQPAERPRILGEINDLVTVLGEVVLAGSPVAAIA